MYEERKNILGVVYLQSVSLILFDNVETMDSAAVFGDVTEKV